MSEPRALVTSAGMDCCVFCWQRFGDEDNYSEHAGVGSGVNYTHGPVVHAETGTEYDHVGASDGGTPLAHPECRKEWAEAINDADATISQFAAGGRDE